jgi:hypothetical protein
MVSSKGKPINQLNILRFHQKTNHSTNQIYYGFIKRQTSHPTKSVAVSSKGKPVSQLNILRFRQKANQSIN